VRKLITISCIIFGAGITALGALQFKTHDYSIARPSPLPASLANVPGKLAWAYISGGIMILLGLTIILSKRRGGMAALIFGAMTLIFSFLLRDLPFMFHLKPEEIWMNLNAYKALGLCGGALIVAATFYEKKGRNVDAWIWIGAIPIAYFLFVCGIAHIRFDAFVISFIPAYIPWHPFWTYFTAFALMAGGVGILIPQTRKWAAFLSGLMILLWFFMLHLPRASYTPNEDAEWMGVGESFVYSGLLFALAGISTPRRSS
jgi:uncharacterized membrane protein YphA (DoxX/SURF4 family)